VKAFFRAFAVAILASLAGCAHSAKSGSPRSVPRVSSTIDVAAVARSIVPCRTTESELRARLGAPTRDGILHRMRVLSWLTLAESPNKYLAVLLDERGVVVDLYWDIPTEIPWTPENQCSGK
jgi:hypothetical protein